MMTRSPESARRPSEVTLRARALVADRRADAQAAGRRLADLAHDPEAFATALRVELGRLADPEYGVGQRTIAPGVGPTFGVRNPLLTALRRGLAAGTRRDRSSLLLALAARLHAEPTMEPRWLAFALLDRTIADEPERSWQLLRRASQDASDWITVDSLAGPVAYGILREPYRWAELEQLTISPSSWERRLVGSAIAVMPFEHRLPSRDPIVARRALPILAMMMGDAEPEVRKALAWAYRSLLLVDTAATLDAIRAETATAVRDRDGNRAWVIRDVLAKLDPASAAEIRAALAGIRRAGSGSTSGAAELRARFAAMGLGRTMPQPPLA
jgi:3-methyladenine DNA glycosylase AlkD